MFKNAEVISTTMLPDNVVLMKYIEENLDGTIPDDYKEVSERIKTL